MHPHRVLAPAISKRHKKKKRKLKTEGLIWLQKQRDKKAWTLFSYLLERLQYCYNLTTSMFSSVCDEYKKGKSGGPYEEPMTPKNPGRIRQDILAAIMISSHGLAHPDFITSKRLATARNTGRSKSLQSESEKWPSRPDLFLHCPIPDPNAVSDDDHADFFIIRRLEEEESDSDSSCNSAPTCREVICEGEVPNSIHGLDGEDQLKRPYTSSYAGDKKTVDILRHLYLQFGSWGSIKTTQCLYNVSRTKSYDLRGALTDLREGKVQGVTWEEFEKTFENGEVMNMSLQGNKIESIKLAVMQHKAHCGWEADDGSQS